MGCGASTHVPNGGGLPTSPDRLGVVPHAKHGHATAASGVAATAVAEVAGSVHAASHLSIQSGAGYENSEHSRACTAEMAVAERTAIEAASWSEEQLVEKLRKAALQEAHSCSSSVASEKYRELTEMDFHDGDMDLNIAAQQKLRESGVSYDTDEYAPHNVFSIQDLADTVSEAGTEDIQNDGLHSSADYDPIPAAELAALAADQSMAGATSSGSADTGLPLARPPSLSGTMEASNLFLAPVMEEEAAEEKSEQQGRPVFDPFAAGNFGTSTSTSTNEGSNLHHKASLHMNGAPKLSLSATGAMAVGTPGFGSLTPAVGTPGGSAPSAGRSPAMRRGGLGAFVDSPLWSALGAASLGKLAQSNILISGIGPVGAAAAYALVCAGVRQITLADHMLVSPSDVVSVPGLTAADVGLNRASAVRKVLIQRLQLRVGAAATIHVADEALSADASVIRTFSAAIVCNPTKEVATAARNFSLRSGSSVPVIVVEESGEVARLTRTPSFPAAAPQPSQCSSQRAAVVKATIDSDGLQATLIVMATDGDWPVVLGTPIVLSGLIDDDQSDSEGSPTKTENGTQVVSVPFDPFAPPGAAQKFSPKHVSSSSEIGSASVTLNACLHVVRSCIRVDSTQIQSSDLYMGGSLGLWRVTIALAAGQATPPLVNSSGKVFWKEARYGFFVAPSLQAGCEADTQANANIGGQVSTNVDISNLLDQRVDENPGQGQRLRSDNAGATMYVAREAQGSQELLNQIVGVAVPFPSGCVHTGPGVGGSPYHGRNIQELHDLFVSSDEMNNRLLHVQCGGGMAQYIGSLAAGHAITSLIWWSRPQGTTEINTLLSVPINYIDGSTLRSNGSLRTPSDLEWMSSPSLQLQMELGVSGVYSSACLLDTIFQVCLQLDSKKRLAAALEVEKQVKMKEEAEASRQKALQSDVSQSSVDSSSQHAAGSQDSSGSKSSFKPSGLKLKVKVPVMSTGGNTVQGMGAGGQGTKTPAATSCPGMIPSTLSDCEIVVFDAQRLSWTQTLRGKVVSKIHTGSIAGAAVVSAIRKTGLCVKPAVHGGTASALLARPVDTLNYHQLPNPHVLFTGYNSPPSSEEAYFTCANQIPPDTVRKVYECIKTLPPAGAEFKRQRLASVAWAGALVREWFVMQPSAANAYASDASLFDINLWRARADQSLVDERTLHQISKSGVSNSGPAVRISVNHNGVMVNMHGQQPDDFKAVDTSVTPAKGDPCLAAEASRVVALVRWLSKVEGDRVCESVIKALQEGSVGASPQNAALGRQSLLDGISNVDSVDLLAPTGVLGTTGKSCVVQGVLLLFRSLLPIDDEKAWSNVLSLLSSSKNSVLHSCHQGVWRWMWSWFLRGVHSSIVLHSTLTANPMVEMSVGPGTQRNAQNFPQYFHPTLFTDWVNDRFPDLGPLLAVTFQCIIANLLSNAAIQPGSQDNAVNMMEDAVLRSLSDDFEPSIQCTDLPPSLEEWMKPQQQHPEHQNVAVAAAATSVAKLIRSASVPSPGSAIIENNTMHKFFVSGNSTTSSLTPQPSKAEMDTHWIVKALPKASTLRSQRVAFAVQQLDRFAGTAPRPLLGVRGVRGAGSAEPQAWIPSGWPRVEMACDFGEAKRGSQGHLSPVTHDTRWTGSTGNAPLLIWSSTAASCSVGGGIAESPNQQALFSLISSLANMKRLLHAASLNCPEGLSSGQCSALASDSLGSPFEVSTLLGLLEDHDTAALVSGGIDTQPIVSSIQDSCNAASAAAWWNMHLHTIAYGSGQHAPTDIGGSTTIQDRMNV